MLNHLNLMIGGLLDDRSSRRGIFDGAVLIELDIAAEQ